MPAKADVPTGHARSSGVPGLGGNDETGLMSGKSPDLKLLTNVFDCYRGAGNIQNVAPQVPQGLIGNPVKSGSGPAAVNGDEIR